MMGEVVGNLGPAFDMPSREPCPGSGQPVSMDEHPQYPGKLMPKCAVCQVYVQPVGPALEAEQHHRLVGGEV